MRSTEYRLRLKNKNKKNNFNDFGKESEKNPENPVNPENSNGYEQNEAGGLKSETQRNPENPEKPRSDFSESGVFEEIQKNPEVQDTYQESNSGFTGFSGFSNNFVENTKNQNISGNFEEVEKFLTAKMFDAFSHESCPESLQAAKATAEGFLAATPDVNDKERFKTALEKNKAGSVEDVHRIRDDLYER